MFEAYNGWAAGRIPARCAYRTLASGHVRAHAIQVTDISQGPTRVAALPIMLDEFRMLVRVTFELVSYRMLKSPLS